MTDIKGLRPEEFEKRAKENARVVGYINQYGVPDGACIEEVTRYFDDAWYKIVRVVDINTGEEIV